MDHVTPLPLANWQNFYVIVGSAAGALTGLQFIAIVLIAQTRATGSMREIRAFGTPTADFGAHSGPLAKLAELRCLPRVLWPGGCRLLAHRLTACAQSELQTRPGGLDLVHRVSLGRACCIGSSRHPALDQHRLVSIRSRGRYPFLPAARHIQLLGYRDLHCRPVRQ